MVNAAYLDNTLIIIRFFLMGDTNELKPLSTVNEDADLDLGPEDADVFQERLSMEELVDKLVRIIISE